jgi:hypothetical protein
VIFGAGMTRGELPEWQPQIAQISQIFEVEDAGHPEVPKNAGVIFGA